VKIVRTSARAARLRGDTNARLVVLVPTMGALHEGHVALMRKARKLAGPQGMVVVSIFVNPAQFGPREDFSRYPRTFARDCKLCEEAGVDAVFHPEVNEMYPEGFSTYVDEERVSLGLCGASRPGHFRGVCTVVLKLFNILGPDAALFGEKDYQQAAVIRRMARDLNVPVRIVTAPTVREADGLALSSRNAYLSPQERSQAPVIRRALLKAAAASFARPGDLARLIRREIAKAPLGKIDYVEVVDARTLEKPGPETRELVIACAVWFGRTRLIDNVRRKNPKFEKGREIRSNLRNASEPKPRGNLTRIAMPGTGRHAG
jgi:pantoate--beta-alanine ligase